MPETTSESDGGAEGASHSIYGSKSFERGLTEILHGIDLCASSGLFIPTLILSLGVMDAFSWIEFPNERDSKRQFVAWVEKWVLPHKQVDCKAVDLYAARAGWLHRMGTKSRLVEGGEAMNISYCHGTADYSVLKLLRDKLKKKGNNISILKVEALVSALKKAVVNFGKKAETDPNLKRRMEEYFLTEQPFRFAVSGSEDRED